MENVLMFLVEFLEIGYVSELEYIAEDIGSMSGYIWDLREKNIIENMFNNF